LTSFKRHGVDVAYFYRRRDSIWRQTELLQAQLNHVDIGEPAGKYNGLICAAAAMQLISTITAATCWPELMQTALRWISSFRYFIYSQLVMLQGSTVSEFGPHLLP